MNLLNYKNYIVIALLGIALISVSISRYNLSRDYSALNQRYTVCQADNNANLIAKLAAQDQYIESQNNMYALEKQLESQASVNKKTTDAIMAQDWSEGGCEGASQKVVQAALQFHWNNNTP